MGSTHARAPMQFPLGFGIGTSYPTGTNYIGGYGNPILNALITTWAPKVDKMIAQTFKTAKMATILHTFGIQEGTKQLGRRARS